MGHKTEDVEGGRERGLDWEAPQSLQGLAEDSENLVTNEEASTVSEHWGSPGAARCERHS